MNELEDAAIGDSPEPPRVLAVDDEPANLLVMAAALESQRYDVEYAASAATARIAAQDHRPSLVLLDVMMPGESGIELCRDWRQSAAMDHTPILLVTALGAADHRTSGLQAGADDFIEKPLNIDSLVARVASWLATGRSAKRQAVAVDTARSLPSRLLAAAREIAPDDLAVNLAGAMARAIGLDSVASDLANARHPATGDRQ